MTAPSNPFSDPAWLRVYATICLAVLRATNAPGAEPDLASVVESERIAKAVYDELRKRYPAFPAEAIASALPADSCTCPPPSGPRTMPDPLCVVHRGRRIRGPKPDSESGVRPWN